MKKYCEHVIGFYSNFNLLKMFMGDIETIEAYESRAGLKFQNII